LGWSQLVELYRFDDRLKGAVAPQASQAAALAAPMAWGSFDEETP
jgi:hypothetical protein